MGLQTVLKNLDKGFFKDAAGARRGATAHLAALALEAGVAPEDAVFTARRAAYFKRFGVTEDGKHGALADHVEALAWDTWVLEQAMADCGLKGRGRDAATVEKFFSTGVSTVLFPVFIDARLVAGILEASLVPRLISEEIPVDSHSADHSSLNEVAADRKTSLTGEGSSGTVVKIGTADRSIKLNKFQCELQASYESLRLVRLPVVARFIERIGMQIGIDETDELLTVAISGDGNASSGVTDTDAEVTGVLDYDELVRLTLAFTQGYEFRQAVLNATNMRTILNMAEFKDPLAGFHFQGTGRFEDRLGAMWHRWNSTGSSAFSTDRILALDDRYALVQYTEGGMIMESDRIIDRQLERSVFSKWTGFGKLDYNATQCLDITT